LFLDKSSSAFWTSRWYAGDGRADGRRDLFRFRLRLRFRFDMLFLRWFTFARDCQILALRDENRL